MDLFAYAISQDETVSDYVAKHYGEPPRFRGVRFMKTETPQKFEPYSWRDESDAGLWTTAMHPTRDWTETNGFNWGGRSTTSDIFYAFKMYRARDWDPKLPTPRGKSRKHGWFYKDNDHATPKAKLQFIYRRYARFKDLEDKQYNENWEKQLNLFNSMCGKDVIQIHTRCGAAGENDSPNRNYRYFQADKWEDGSPLFIASIDDGWDWTYRDHYFHAVEGEDYDKIITMLEKLKED